MEEIKQETIELVVVNGEIYGAKQYKWDMRFLNLAKEISSWSKDTSTKVGSVLVGPHRNILTTGYNGLPRGADDSNASRLERPEKYFWFEHAERNAIYNAARTGVGLQGSTAYSTLCPCMDCARAFIQSGVSRVVTYDYRTSSKANDPKWCEQHLKAVTLFKECGVELALY